MASTERVPGVQPGPSLEQMTALREQFIAVLPPGTDPAPWIVAMFAVNPMVQRTVPQVYKAYGGLLGTVYGYLSLKERIQLNSNELLLGIFYIGIIAVYYFLNPRVLFYTFSQLSNFLVPAAYSQTSALTHIPTRDVIFSLLAISIVITILMSAYAALFKEPPSSTGKEILKYTLAFATGVLATFLGAKP